MAEETLQRRVGARMREAAHAKGLTAYQVAAALKVAPPTVYRWWSGKNAPAAAMLDAYAELAGVPVSWFYATDADTRSGKEEAEFPPEFIDRTVGMFLDWYTGGQVGNPFSRKRNRAAFDRYRQSGALDQALGWVVESVREEFGKEWPDLDEEQRQTALRRLNEAILDDYRRKQPPEPAPESS